MAQHTRQAGAGCLDQDRLDSQASIQLAPRSFSGRVADYVFAFHDGEEIGPRMLARIGKKTGLKPEDL